MKFKRVLVITDNIQWFGDFRQILAAKSFTAVSFRYYCSPASKKMFKDLIDQGEIEAVVLKEHETEIIEEFDLVISLHCKQLFSSHLVNAVTCINIHPGLNPNNRGWYPQVFSILNKLPHGATIHLIDEELDHGAIIAQEEVPIYAWDTSLSVYERTLQAELKLIEENIEDILESSFTSKNPDSEGNVNYKADFNKLREIDLAEEGTFGDFVDRLRALSHGEFKNAYFTTPEGEKVFLKLELTKEG